MYIITNFQELGTKTLKASKKKICIIYLKIENQNGFGLLKNKTGIWEKNEKIPFKILRENDPTWTSISSQTIN